MSEDGAPAKAADTAATTVLPADGSSASEAAPTTKMPAANGGGNPPTPPAGVTSTASEDPEHAPASADAASNAYDDKRSGHHCRNRGGVVVLGVAATLALGLWGTVMPAESATQQTTVQSAGNTAGSNVSQSDNADDATTNNDAATNNGTGSGTGTGAGSGTAQGSGFGHAYGQRHHHDIDDYDDQVEYEQSLALLNALDGVTAASLKSMAEGNTTFEQMFRALPLGDYVESVGQDQSATAVNVRYAKRAGGL